MQKDNFFTTNKNVIKRKLQTIKDTGIIATNEESWAICPPTAPFYISLIDYINDADIETLFNELVEIGNDEDFYGFIKGETGPLKVINKTPDTYSEYVLDLAFFFFFIF